MTAIQLILALIAAAGVAVVAFSGIRDAQKKSDEALSKCERPNDES